MHFPSLFKSKVFFAAATLLNLIPVHKAQGECMGKIDIAPAYIHVDVIESRNTIKELDMAGARLDLSFVIGKGWTIRPNAIYGKEKDGELISASIGFGRCIPCGERWVLTPLVGVGYTTLGTSIHIDLGEMGEHKFKERFEGYAPYLGLEVYYRIASNMRIVVNGQYAWSHSKTRVKHLFTSKSDAQGPSYGALFEYDLNSCWSVNIGGAYNESYSKEKDGIRARGLKLGLAHWF